MSRDLEENIDKGLTVALKLFAMGIISCLIFMILTMFGTFIFSAWLVNIFFSAMFIALTSMAILVIYMVIKTL